ncbi:carboxypeptidase-like regulatory domain-containing protein [Candidatus Marinimicrobia bacterium]|nr:carboxypeptidase-like regulatory domain-containing protein [Candidatus Neomarinimicrobiota bacterium]
MKLLVILSAIVTLEGQSSINGQIVDKETGEPLIGVNVFISKTSIGTTTDKDGLYTIKNISNGRYELVISMIGYAMDKKELNLFTNIQLDIDFWLTTEPINMKQIIVTKKSNKQWKKDYKVFKNAFLGNSKNGKSCKIINEYVLSFNRGKNILSASTQKPLIIENMQLGYVVTYYLKEFATNNTFLRSDDESFFNFLFISSTKFVRYTGESFFTEMKPKSERQKRQWIKNRQIAYNGSLRHFLATLGKRFDRRYKMKGDSLRQRNDWLLISGSKIDPLTKEGFEIYLKEEYKKRYDYRELLNDRLVWSTKNDNELLLSFKDKMMVKFKREGEELNYLFYTFESKSKPKTHQTSFLKLGKDSVIFDKNGRYFEKFMIEQQEYMGWERVGDQLPFDYKPIQD